MADVVFRSTYADILCPGQMDYMMDWMYSEQSLLMQIAAPGKVFLVAWSPAGPEQGNGASAGTASETGQSEGNDVLASSEGSVPAGYVSYEYEDTLPDGRRQYHLQKLYVMPEFQGRGLGRQLFRTVLDNLESANPGGFRMELNVNRNNPAVTFYEHLGLTRDRQGDFPIGKGWFMNDYIYVVNRVRPGLQQIGSDPVINFYEE